MFEDILKRMGYIGRLYGESPGDGMYGYIPFYRYDYLIEVFNNHITANTRFIDVGCGIGDKLAFVNIIKPWAKVTGLELEKDNVVIANYLRELNNLPYRVIEGNAITFDYSKYDFIYMYHPISNAGMYRLLLDRILETAEDGTILLEVLHEEHNDKTRIVPRNGKRTALVKIENHTFIEIKDFGG